MYNIGQAKLYYLFMRADGNVSEGEDKLFTSICRELKITDSEKKEIIKTCNAIVENDDRSCIDIVKENAKHNDQYGKNGIDLQKSEGTQTKNAVMWHLINLGYADSYYTQAEREVVDFLREFWEIRDDVYNEMIDVAETILSLSTMKKWVENTFPDGEEKNKKLEKILQDISFVQEMIKLTISEIN